MSDRPMAGPLDKSAVDRLVVEHLPAALRVALRLTRNADAAEDVVQDMLCRVLSKWPDYRGESSFKTWMLGILINAERDRRRKVRLHAPLDDEMVVGRGQQGLDYVAVSELHQRIQEIVDALPQRQREVAILTWGEGLSAGEAADSLGISEASVYTNLHLARRRIA